MPPIKEYDYDQDVATDDEALEESINRLEDHFRSAIREFSAMPFPLAKSMLKSSSIMERVQRPEEYDNTGMLKPQTQQKHFAEPEELSFCL
jgi:hypothetical protein